MRYIMKQKLFSIKDKFTIQDETENTAYLIEGTLFTLGNRLSFQNKYGEELLNIKQKVLSFITTYEILKDEQVYAIVKKEPFTLFRSKFTIEVYNGDYIEVQGNFIDHEYQFTKGQYTIGSVSKEFFSWSDTYGIDVAEGEDDELILACAVIIDMISHNGKRR
ncbi:LURP-one-related family protein [Alkalicella caledoniensis]|uniref:LURP-one-related family protein n=1 Tax=Alkalicella caledoniensis TaxID=2731377 RepID=A0A7G9WA17_ALKCA|nr:LURP-one-related family protein [Alkalicella caledoniensis]QNO15529.1 LURP-one-related family protein [Alkalicella caledoniensis]